MEFKHILIIQTAFIGDVVLATPLIKKLRQHHPSAKIDFLLRKGNESLLEHDPDLHEILIWNKSKGRITELVRLIRKIRSTRYDMVVNVQRFASMGILTWFSKAPIKIGFDKNPFSRFYTKKIKHNFSNGKHEVERNLKLISDFTDSEVINPKMHFNGSIEKSVSHYKMQEYIVIAPTSVWPTKQLPMDKWVEFLNKLTFKGKIYLIGSVEDEKACEKIRQMTSNKNVVNVSGKLSLLESASLMKDAKRNYVNDSAPLHFASAFNAPVTAVFCSTTPDFGFGPLSDDSQIMETESELDCKPCGIHGYRKCPKGHFKCSEIDVSKFQTP